MAVMLSKRVLKSIKPKPKTPEGKAKLPVTIKFGKPVFQVTFTTIKFFAGLGVVLLICNLILSLKLFSSSIGIRNHLGYFINMISKGDGDVLPSLQALPVLLFLCIDIVFAFMLCKLFETDKKPRFNWFLFISIMASLVLILIILIVIISVLSHSYATHEELHNGIVDAMKNYSSNSWYKMQIDRLQIEFQCCGSKNYDEWYNITWYDTSLVKREECNDNSQGNTPYSCCSISSIFPCIHHNIENTGKIYLYTPEQNLSISTDGCYTRLRKKKKEVGWRIVGNLFSYIFLQGALVICLRFLQTAHCVNSKFEGHSKSYTIWLFGCYTGKKKEAVPPLPPPVPPDLLD